MVKNAASDPTQAFTRVLIGTDCPVPLILWSWTSPGFWRTSGFFGHTSLGAIADELNARGILTRRGGRWHKSTVMNLLERLGQRACASPA